jgi:hypothetical protein
MRAHEPFRKKAALQVGAQLVLYIPREPAFVVLAGVREERLEVLPDEAVEHRVGGTAWKIGRRENGHDTLRLARHVPESR